MIRNVTARPDGGPAYPAGDSTELRNGAWVGVVYEGMSLRDYFAGQALAGFCANSTIDHSYEDMADMVVKQADAVLEALAARDATDAKEPSP